jgi:hypothetical protein
MPSVSGFGQAGPEEASWKTPVGLGLGVAGLLAGAAGGYLQLQADEHWRELSLSSSGARSDEPGASASLRQQAESQQALARAAFVASGAALAGGVVLLLLDTGPASAPSSVAVKVSASLSSVGVRVLFP